MGGDGKGASGVGGCGGWGKLKVSSPGSRLPFCPVKL